MLSTREGSRVPVRLAVPVMTMIGLNRSSRSFHQRDENLRRRCVRGFGLNRSGIRPFVPDP